MVEVVAGRFRPFLVYGPRPRNIPTETPCPKTEAARPPMTPTNTREMLIRDEGKVPYCYQDSLGYDTIGVGRLIDRRKGGGLSDDEIELLLDNDIRKCEQQVAFRLPWTAQLDEPRKAVLVAMAFQLGIDGLMGFVRTLGMVKNGQFELAAQAMMQSKWAKQTPLRAERMAEQMDTGVWV